MATSKAVWIDIDADRVAKDFDRDGITALLDADIRLRTEVVMALAEDIGCLLVDAEECESPIEALLCVWLRRYLDSHIDGRHQWRANGPVVDGWYDLKIQQEVLIDGKTYRPDFLLYVFQFHDGENHCLAKIAIECDGHEFHERTKDQARRDRSRDRAFVGGGVPVLRFTGSEIHANPRQCARECIDRVRALCMPLIRGGDA